MTTSQMRAPQHVRPETHACVQQDVQQLAEQMRRCRRSHSPARAMHQLADALRGFTSRHVSSLLAAALMLAVGVRLAS